MALHWKPGGEFGSALRWIFDPKAEVQFVWDREESSAGVRSCVFRYRVPATASTYTIQADADHVTMALHGSGNSRLGSPEQSHTSQSRPNRRP